MALSMRAFTLIVISHNGMNPKEPPSLDVILVSRRERRCFFPGFVPCLKRSSRKLETTRWKCGTELCKHFELTDQSNETNRSPWEMGLQVRTICHSCPERENQRIARSATSGQGNQLGMRLEDFQCVLRRRAYCVHVIVTWLCQHTSAFVSQWWVGRYAERKWQVGQKEWDNNHLGIPLFVALNCFLLW